MAAGASPTRSITPSGDRIWIEVTFPRAEGVLFSTHMRKSILALSLAALAACADKLTGPEARSAAAAYQAPAIAPKTRVFVNGVERDMGFLRTVNRELIDSILIDVTKRVVADGTDSQTSEIRVFLRPAKPQ